MSEHQSGPGDDDPGETLRLPDAGYPLYPPQPLEPLEPLEPPQPPSPLTPSPPTPPPGVPPFLQAYPPAGTRPGHGRQRDSTASHRSRPPSWVYWVAGVVVVAALATGGIVLAVSGGSGDATTTSSSSALPAPVASPSGPIRPSATPSSELSLAQTRLADILDPFALRECRPSSIEGNFNADAALACKADEVGEVRALHYFDSDALADEVKRRSAAIEDVGRCVDGKDSVEKWGRSTRTLGTLMCFSDTGGSHLFWTVDASLAGFEASGPDGAGLVRWWLHFEPLV